MKQDGFASKGTMIINTVAISDLEKNKTLNSLNSFGLSDENLDILKVPYYATSLNSFKWQQNMCFWDYKLNSSGDEDLRWELKTL